MKIVASVRHRYKKQICASSLPVQISTSSTWSLPGLSPKDLCKISSLGVKITFAHIILVFLHKKIVHHNKANTLMIYIMILTHL